MRSLRISTQMSSGLFGGTFLRTSRCKSNAKGVNCCNQASLTMSAVSSTFEAHQSVHSEERQFALVDEGVNKTV